MIKQIITLFLGFCFLFPFSQVFGKSAGATLEMVYNPIHPEMGDNDTVTIEDIFVAMPDNVLFGLAPEDKVSLVAKAESDTSLVVVQNMLRTPVQRIGFSKDYISLKTSEAGKIEVKLLSLINDSKVICVVKTVCGGVCDSQVQFYTSKWKAITQDQLFPEPQLDWFIKKEVDKNSQEYKNALTIIKMHTMKIELSPTGTDASLFFDIESGLVKEKYDKIKPFLIEKPIILAWDKTSYKQGK